AIPHYILTGSTPKEKRMEMVETFNENDISVFLISLKAGGTGLNLIGADVVIHYDPWWNLAAQNQATDRTHRIGQKKSVQVYKLIAEDTIEEKILKLQESKVELAESVIGENSGLIEKMTREELLALI
ncbi:MAG: C-terminal helicase domain-containing protein, partial [Anaerovorax sp.]